MAVTCEMHRKNDCRLMEVLDRSVVCKLGSTAEINHLLRETHLQERELEAELESLSLRRADVEGTLSTLHTTTFELLELAKADAEGLAASVHQTSSLSEKVSRKVRELDTAQSHVQEALARIKCLVSRSTAVEGVQQALRDSDYETAAGFVQSFLQLQQELGKEGADSLQVEEQEKVLLDAQDQLLKIVRQRLDAAVKEKRHEMVLRFAKLYNPLGAKEEGLTWFVQYLRGLVKQRAEEEYAGLVESTDAQPDFVDALTALLRDLGAAIQENEEYISESFGAQSLLQILDGLQAECDQSGVRLLQRFIRQRRLEQAVQDIRSNRALRRTDTQQAAAVMDPRQMEGILEEMLLLCQRAEEYNQFVLEKAADAIAPELVPAVHENAFRSGPFSTVVRELISYYINMEEFYIEQSVEKGIEIDEWTQNALATSMVDDVFFIIQKCSQRALATGSLQCVCAILGQINAVLSTSFRAALDSRWKGASAVLLQGLAACIASDAVAAAGQREGLAVSAFNNADLSASYALKMQDHLEAIAVEVFPLAHDRERIKSVLADVAKTAAEFRHIAENAIDHLCSGVLIHIRGPFEEVDASRYELSEAEYESNEADMTWVDSLLNLLVAVLQWFQPLLTEANNECLVSTLLGKVTDRLEASMHLKRFNQLGGLQLDRNVRVMVSSLSEITQQTVRDKFAKLSQMATILSLESVSEVQDYWGESSQFSWRLTENQVREILGQRTEFDRQDIAVLVL